jgi:hypothetical protein
MMDVNLLLYLFLFRIDEPKNLTAEKNRRGGRISRGKHTQLNSVECMIFWFLQSSKPSRCVPTVSRPSSFLACVTPRLSRSRVTGRPKQAACLPRHSDWQACLPRHSDWRRSGRRIGSGLGLTRTRPSMRSGRSPAGPGARRAKLPTTKT